MAKGVISINAMQFPWSTQAPFLFCAHHRDEYPKGNSEMGPSRELLEGRNIGQDFTIKDGWRMYHGSKVPGFPFHPHRGFETITINREGFVDHTDSLGASGRFGKGDVQWMTAGKGIQHSEMFPLVDNKIENPLEIFQIWLNLPRKSKMVDPHFKMFWNEDLPRITRADKDGKNTTIDLVAGALDEKVAISPPPDSWAADPLNNISVLVIEMQANAKWILPKASKGLNSALYFYKGSEILLNGNKVSSYQQAILESNVDIEIQNGDAIAYMLFLRGKPINEPVVQYGPFVMNTEEEIRETFNDFQRTEFGGWPWPEREQTHPRETNRFAKHSDGTEERP